MVQHCWSCWCQTQHHCSTYPSCCCLQWRSDLEVSGHQTWVYSFSLWINLWGIVVIQRNVWSCEELSCWKSSLVLSHTCLIFPVSFTKGNHQLLRALQYDSVGAAFLASFFLFIWIIPRITWELITEDVYFFPGVHHRRATALWKSPFIWAFLFLPVSVLHLSNAFMLMVLAGTFLPFECEGRSWCSFGKHC